MAYFFDLDGTLAEIELNPAQVRLADPVRASLGDLVRATDGAVAIVSGRAVAEVDRILAPLSLPTAGLHGAERRGGDGTSRRDSVDSLALDSMRRTLTSLVAGSSGLLLESKPTGFALHFRAVPDMADLVRRSLETAIAPYRDGFTLQPGKMVLEIKPRGVDKGLAIVAFLRERPFAGRRPVFAGDDATDEAGFAVVNAAGGLSIKIGEGETLALHRLPSVLALSQWIAQRKEPAA